MTIIPSDDQLAQIIDAKSEHSNQCAGRTWFDLSHYEIVVRCNCGWEHRIETIEKLY